ncbi:hypothetical protein [Phenylobacterium sp.]|uniref:hypothetical protein n=1 Tax=Phenylobacterium sp. TaxID=1871053 RepID=UPI002810A1F4|nr:hypothetical protein [Phenylobacterium sp.]
MSQPAPLSGLSVLVLEDDFYIAEDTRGVLEDAGASVLGPFAAAEPALLEAERRQADCALVDINLGLGPDFAPAERLLQLGVPIVLVTGYDHRIIPEPLSGVPCLQKPAQARKIVAAIQTACNR